MLHVEFNGVQDTPPQHLPLWHIQSFKWKKSENMAEAGSSHWPSFALYPGNTQVWDPHPPLTRREGISSSWKMDGCLKESKQTSFAKFPLVFYSFSSYFFTYQIPPQLSTFHQTYYKTLRFNFSFFFFSARGS